MEALVLAFGFSGLMMTLSLLLATYGVWKTLAGGKLVEAAVGAGYCMIALMPAAFSLTLIYLVAQAAEANTLYANVHSAYININTAIMHAVFAQLYIALAVTTLRALLDTKIIDTIKTLLKREEKYKPIR